ncbi:Tn7-like element transposition protein TnsE [Metabacillus fastidiosus]|uniref:Tn7-like element transposition protein TnsE n=1 Tax=Metabacillus fastidiosus TaxID=1458 RepID=UPI003D287E22
MKEDENTKKYYINHDSIRSTADSGGQQLVRGLEHQMLHEIQAQGELQDFINMMKVMEQHPQVKVIKAFTDVLPEGLGERKFTKLSDGVTKRRYMIAEVYMVNGKRFNIIEVEREKHSMSMLILSSSTINNWNTMYYYLLLNLVNDNGTWTSKTLKNIVNQGVIVIKEKHSSKGIHHKSKILLNKLI